VLNTGPKKENQLAQRASQSESFQVRDSFEIKCGNSTEHPAGLVVVLDRCVTGDPAALVGSTAIVCSDAKVFRIAIDAAKDHLQATSLFFSGRCLTDVPVESEIMINRQLSTTAPGVADC